MTTLAAGISEQLKLIDKSKVATGAFIAEGDLPPFKVQSSLSDQFPGVSLDFDRPGFLAEGEKAFRVRLHRP